MQPNLCVGKLTLEFLWFQCPKLRLGQQALEVPQVDFGADLDVRSKVVFVRHPVMPVGDCLGGGFVGADELQLRERDAQ